MGVAKNMNVVSGAKCMKEVGVAKHMNEVCVFSTSYILTLKQVIASIKTFVS